MKKAAELSQRLTFSHDHARGLAPQPEKVRLPSPEGKPTVENVDENATIEFYRGCQSVGLTWHLPPFPGAVARQPWALWESRDPAAAVVPLAANNM